MAIETMIPGTWPEDQNTIDELLRLACYHLGRDFHHLGPEVLTKVMIEWNDSSPKEQDSVQIRTLVRSRAADVRKSEQRRTAREEKSAAVSPDDADAQRRYLTEATDALLRAGLGAQHEAILRMVVAGDRKNEIAASLEISTYHVNRCLEEIGRALWPER